MPSEPAWRGVSRGYRGFALLIVLWTLVLVAFIVPFNPEDDPR